MWMDIRKVGVACGVVVTSTVLALTGAMPSWASSSALVVGGIGTPTVSDLVMRQLLGGVLNDKNNPNGIERRDVEWPAQAGPKTGKDDMSLGDSIDIGIANLTAQIDAALGRLSRDADGNVLNGEKVTVVGLSAGSLVVTEVLRNLSTDEGAAPASEIRFYVAEDSSRQEWITDSMYNPSFDYTYQPAPQVKYDVVVVTGEFDGFADLPDNKLNVLAMANAMAGAITVHIPVMFTDLSTVPLENVTVTVNPQGGTTTHYLVPTETLPLVVLNPSLKPREAELRAKIEKAYKRYDDVPTTTPGDTEGPDTSGGTPTGSATLKERLAANAAARAERQAANAEARAEREAARQEAQAERRAAREQAQAERKAAREERQAARAETRAQRQSVTASSDSDSSD